jgi:long-chain acyl-CoA synthetase
MTNGARLNEEVLAGDAAAPRGSRDGGGGGDGHAPSHLRHVPPRVPLDAGEPTTLPEVFERAAREHAKPDALNYKRDGEWRAISSEEFLERARSVALGLHALGIRRGDRVALLSESRPEWTITDAGCQLAGVIDVPIYPTQATPQVSYILNDSGARALFVSGRAAYERIADALGEAPGVERVFFFDPDGAEESGATTLEDLIARGRELNEQRPGLIGELARAVSPEDLSTIIYTSGTTGEPKGVMLTHSNFVSNLIDSSGHLAFSERDVALSVLPLSHVLERLGMYMYVHHGMSVYFAESLEKIGDNMREVRPTVMLCVPRLFEKILARIRERAAAKGKLSAGILAWAVDVANRWAKYRRCSTCNTTSPIGSSCANGAKAWAAGCACSSPAARRSRPRSATRSTALGSQSSRATG